MLKLEILLEKSQNKLIQRRKMLKLNMKRIQKSTKIGLENKVKFNKRISLSSRINTRKSKKFIREKWLICKKD